ncbi:tautomerase family protein [Enterococcus gilvus]|uniref:Tautomerase enzyme n=1 Tax=Enterococcus gilvus ATCC BAA-350 TaxID=1158614 RepID=R2XZH9_9ENTE|nr:hypothetical protein [Enterococcus gilvus]EOI55447.1 hypothetical protein UKC_02655 [Enterococcus gilvus ATCC BAA-350]EOW82010.1 hypothetical protein I592_01311 [Enterococcus gilvus ATCC BAA-350]OJG43039.1 hypothetical protein RV02_GL002959 [Enterococcus gilvus]
MPFFTITTSLPLNKEEKEKISLTITKLTVSELKVAPDKVQVLVQTGDKENFARSGVSPTSSTFSSDSRKVDGLFEASYFSGTVSEEDLILVELDIWRNFSVNEKSILGYKITDFFKKEYHVSGDNVLILIRDMDPSNWIQNGVSGIDEEFLDRSRNR